MSNPLNSYSPFNQRELKVKVILINFLILMKFLKEKGVIKKNGKFPPVEYRHEGRSSYEAYFVTALRKLLKYFFPGMEIKKQRNGMEFKIYGPSRKIIYDSSSPNSLVSKLALMELQGSLQDYNFNRQNQRLRVMRRYNDFYINYTYTDQIGTNYSPVDFFQDQATEIGSFNPVEDGFLEESVIESLRHIHEKFLANPQDYEHEYVNAQDSRSVLSNLNERVATDRGYSQESKRLLIEKINELRGVAYGMGIPQLYELAKMHLASEPEVNNIPYNDVYEDIAA